MTQGNEGPKISKRPSAPGGADRRTHTRARLETDVTFASGTNFYSGFVEDVSSGGIFVETYDLKPIGTDIDVSFKLPNGHEVHTHGIVRWVRDTRQRDGAESPGMGLQFVALSDDDKAHIEEFVAARAPIFYDDE